MNACSGKGTGGPYNNTESEKYLKVLYGGTISKVLPPNRVTGRLETIRLCPSQVYPVKLEGCSICRKGYSTSAEGS